MRRLALVRTPLRAPQCSGVQTTVAVQTVPIGGRSRKRSGRPTVLDCEGFDGVLVVCELMRDLWASNN